MDDKNLAAFTDPSAQLGAMVTLLERIAKASESAPANPAGRFDIAETTQHTSLRMRVSHFVFSVSANAQVALLIGTRTYIFYCLANTLYNIPFPVVINNGTNVSVDLTAGNLGTCYFVYEPVTE